MLLIYVLGGLAPTEIADCRDAVLGLLEERGGDDVDSADAAERKFGPPEHNQRVYLCSHRIATLDEEIVEALLK